METNRFLIIFTFSYASLMLNAESLVNEVSTQTVIRQNGYGFLEKPYSEYSVYQQVQIQKAKLRFLKKCRSNKRPPPSLRIQGASSIAFSKKVNHFSALETQMLQIAINDKDKLIKSLVKQSMVDSSPTERLPFRVIKSMRDHFSQRLTLFRRQDKTKWKDWPEKVTLPNCNPQGRCNHTNFKKAKNKVETEKTVQNLFDNDSVVNVVILVDEEIHPSNTSVQEKGANTEYFVDMKTKTDTDINKTDYIVPPRILDSETELHLVIRRYSEEIPQSRYDSCHVLIYVGRFKLGIALGMFQNFGNEIEGYIGYTLGDYNRSDMLEVQDVNTIKITFGKRNIYMEVNQSGDKRKIKRNHDFEQNHNDLLISITNQRCLNFVETRSYVKQITAIDGDHIITENQSMITEDITTEDPGMITEDITTEDPGIEKLSVEFCRKTDFRDCEMTNIKLNEVWSDFHIKSIIILDIPKDRAIRLTSELHAVYTVEEFLVHNNLAGAILQREFYAESEGDSSIVAAEYVIYNEPQPKEKPTIDPLVTKKLPRDSITNLPSKKPEQERLEDVKMLVDVTVEFKPKSNEEKTLKTWKPDFQGAVVPKEVFKKEACKYSEDRNSSNLLGYLTYNGFTDIGITTSNKKKRALNGNMVESAGHNADIDEDTMVETIKAFQKFNGFPETGELTQKQTEILDAPRCGNRDTSFRDELDAFHCIEGKVVESDQIREECDLDRDTIMDICAYYTTEFATDSEEKDKFISNKGYYFEADIDFNVEGKPVSHIGIAFNYDNETREADYLSVQSERVYSRLCFSYGTYKQGRREEIENIRGCVGFDKDQEVIHQFKIRLTVNPVETGRTYLSVNGKRAFYLKPSVSTRSSVFLFSLGGRHFIKHKVKIFTSRICKRNMDLKTTSKRKKRAETQFKWYANGGPISYAFVNYSTSLGEQLTRQEIIRAIDVYSSHGLKFREYSPILAESANIVFMFMEDTRHADGMRFLGAGMEKAHAFVPVHGEIHFNGFEKYSVDKGDKTTSLFYVALHEMGHALGLAHSPMRDAIMTAVYDPDIAYQKDDLDDDDIASLQSHYRKYNVTIGVDKLLSNANSGNFEFESVEGLAKGKNYAPRLPLPKRCLNRIEAAFYFYDRNGIQEHDKVYLMSHGYLWAYKASTFAMLKGYPKRTAEVFFGATGEIDAAFDTGTFVYIIVQEKVFIYESFGTAFAKPINVPSPQTLKSLFRISDNKIKSAFNHYKTGWCARGAVCVKTILIIDTEKYYEVSWKKRGKRYYNTISNNAVNIIGEKFSKHQFEAAFEYNRSIKNAVNQTTKEVLQFDNRRTARSRPYFPGDSYEPRTGSADVPELFRIAGWCNDLHDLT